MRGREGGAARDLRPGGVRTQGQVAIYRYAGDQVRAVVSQEQRFAIGKSERAAAEGAAIKCPGAGIVIQRDRVAGVVDRASNIHRATRSITEGADAAGRVERAAEIHRRG